MSRHKIISFVVPVFNEEENIEPLYCAVNSIMSGYAETYDYEFVFTDNHSTDNTYRLLEGLAAIDNRVRVYRFSKNIGYQKSISVGYRKCRGAAAMQLDCDMQDPPHLIPKFIEYWEAGHQVVYGIRRSRKEAWYVNCARRIFYRVLNFLSEDHLPPDAGDFRLVDRVVLDELQSIEDSQPYLRGTIAAMGFNQIGVPYDRERRTRGISKFSLKDYVDLSIDGIVNHSTLPLRISTYTGLVVSSITFVAIFGYVVGKLFFSDSSWPAGFTTITVLLLLSLSLNALFLGIIGEYLARIYKQVKPGCPAIIEKQIDNAGVDSAV